MQNKLKFSVNLAKKIFFCRDTGILTLCLLGAGLLSVCLEQELLSDLFMYHYYNGFAFLNNRLAFDIAPGQVATYYNPLLDTAWYLLNKTFSQYPFMFVMGFPAGIALFLTYKIADLFFPERKSVWIPACLLISLTGFSFFRQIGTCSHEITLACFVLAALYLLLKNPTKSFPYFIAGALLGAAAGLKLTVAVYCVSTGITLILFYKKLEKPKTFIGLFILGGLTGFLATNGFWLWTLWKNFQNPFFPFWNKIFKSPYFFHENYVDDLHLSYSWKKLLFLPFWIFSENIRNLADPKSLTGNISFFDARWVIGYFLLFGFLIKLFNRDFRANVSEKTLFIVTFLFISYLTWLLSSQNIRFAVPVEMLFGIVFIKALSLCPYPKGSFKEVAANSAVFTIFLILVLTAPFSAPWGVYFRFSVPDNAVLPKNALILTNDTLTSYLAATLAERTNARIINSFDKSNVTYSDFSDSNRFSEVKKELVAQNRFPVISLLYLPKNEEPQRKNNSCYRIKTEEKFILNEKAHFFLCSEPEIINNIFYNDP